MRNVPTDPNKKSQGGGWPAWLLPTDVPLSLVCTDAREHISSNGNPCLVVTLHEVDPNTRRATDRRVTHYGVCGYDSFSECMAVIAPEIPPGQDFDPSILKGRWVRVVLRKDSYEGDNGRMKDSVKVDKWLPMQQGAPAPQQAPPQQQPHYAAQAAAGMPPQQNYPPQQQGYPQQQQGQHGSPPAQHGYAPGYGQTYGQQPQPDLPF